MKYIKEFGIILIFSFVGEVLHHFVPLPIPASIYGILLLFVFLQFHILPLESVKQVGDFLVEMMPIMFIPAAVGLLDSWKIIKSSLVSYVIVTIFTTILVMVVAGRVTQALLGKKGEKDDE